ncbi:MAG: hypothetical protein ABI227_07815 [Rhodanobacter sp.]
MKFSRWVFLLAAIYGVLALLPMYFQESMVARMQPPAITHPEYYYGFIGVALAWQLAFLLLSRDPLRYRPIMIPATLEKVTFGIAALVLYLQQRLSLLMLGAGCADLLFAALFLLAYWRTRKLPVWNK